MYFIVVLWQYIAMFVLIRFLACLLPLAIGTFVFALFVAKNWKNDLQQLDEMVKIKQPKADICEWTNEFIRSHMDVKRLR